MSELVCMSSCFTCGPLPTEFLLPNIPHDDVALLRQQKVDGLTTSSSSSVTSTSLHQPLRLPVRPRHRHKRQLRPHLRHPAAGIRV